MAKDYEIRLYDEVLGSFTVQSRGLEGPSVVDQWFSPELAHLLPPALVPDRSAEALWRWMGSRVIPKNRAFVDEILEQAGLVQGDTMGIIDASRGLSLNDSYWIVPAGFQGTWADYNLYHNEFDAVLALVAYTGYTSSQRHAAGISSEWTTSGNYPKAWRRIGGEVVLYKGGSPIFEGAANPDMGPYSEVICSQVARRVGVPHVDYHLDMWKGRLASVCPLFTDEGTSFVPFWAATGTGKVTDALGLLARREDELLESYLDLLVFDSLVVNTDRHANNFGLMRDNATGEYLGLAPLFDHNLALFPHDTIDDAPLWRQRAARRFPAGSEVAFDDVAREVVLERHHQWCRRLLDFEPTNDGTWPMDQGKLDAIGGLVRDRARTILRMEPHTIEEVRGMALGLSVPKELSDMPLFAQDEMTANLARPHADEPAHATRSFRPERAKRGFAR